MRKMDVIDTQRDTKIACGKFATGEIDKSLTHSELQFTLASYASDWSTSERVGWAWMTERNCERVA